MAMLSHWLTAQRVVEKVEKPCLEDFNRQDTTEYSVVMQTEVLLLRNFSQSTWNSAIWYEF